MKRECDNYPDLNHENCILDPYETATVEHFESQGFTVERLCTVWLPDGEVAPDFRITDDKGWRCLCEVKKLTSSTGALSESDWKYTNRIEFERLKAVAEEKKVRLIARPDQIKLWEGEIPYPEEGRNTEEKEREYEKAITDLLMQSSVSNSSLKVTIHRGDPFIWTEKERREFVDELVRDLEVIGQGQVPWNWERTPFGVIGSFSRKRDYGRSIRNHIEVREKQTSPLVIKSRSYLGINWKRIEKNCRGAQRQIRDRLKRETRPEDIVRLVVVFLSKDLIFEYYPQMEKLENEINRHILSKCPELSAVAICKVSEICDISQSFGPFLVFHTKDPNMPSVLKHAFPDSSSVWLF